MGAPVQTKSYKLTEVYSDPVWERQEGEPIEWYRRFQEYLTQNAPRSIREVYRNYQAKKGSKKAIEDPASINLPGQWTTATVRWDWRARADMYDDWKLEAEKHKQAELELIAFEEAKQATKDMVRRHIQIAMVMSQAGYGAFVEEKDQNGKKVLAPKAIEDPEVGLKVVQFALKAEREARGLPDFVLDIARMTDDQLIAYHASKLGSLLGSGEGATEETDQAPGDEAQG